MTKKQNRLIIQQCKDESNDRYCSCSHILKEILVYPWYYASPHCPVHNYLWAYKRNDKTLRLPKNIKHKWHTRFSFCKLASQDEVRKVLKLFFDTIRKKHEDLLYFGRLHYGASAGLHIHFSLASNIEFDETYLSNAWRYAHKINMNEEIEKPSYAQPMKYGWHDNCRYILRGYRFLIKKGETDFGDLQLPPYGHFKRLVRCSKLFLGENKKD